MDGWVVCVRGAVEEECVCVRDWEEVDAEGEKSVERAAVISAREHEAFMDMPCMTPSDATPRVIPTSPSGWPRRARAAGETKMGREVGMPRIVVEVWTWETLFILSRG